MASIRRMSLAAFAVLAVFPATFAGDRDAVPVADAPSIRYVFAPWPAAKIEALAPALKQPERVVSPKTEELSVGDLAGFAFRVEFDEAQTMPRLAVVRVGWGDWALPAEVELRVDGGAPRRFKLSAARVSPNNKSAELPADLIDLFGPDEEVRAVKSLEMRVVEVEAKANRHGSLKLRLPSASSVEFALGDVGAWEKSAGAKASVTVPEAASGAFLAARARQYRADRTWRFPLPPLAAGENSFSVDWADFTRADRPNERLAPANIHKLAVEFPGAVSDARLEAEPVAAPGPEPLGFWESFPAPDFRPGPDGWRGGPPPDGFGRFGYQADNGLLTMNLEGDAFAVPVAGGFSKFHWGNGGRQRTSWRRVRAASDHMEITQLKRFEGAVENKVTSRAFGEFDASRLPERVVAGVLAPGFLIHSRDTVFTLRPDTSYGKPRLIYMDPNGQRREREIGEEAVELSDLGEGWLVVVYEKRPGTPLLLALEQKPLRAMLDGDAFGLVFGQARGWIGVSAPAGYRDRPEAADDPELARRLAALLRRYPLQSRIRFRDDLADGYVDFEENFRHLSWDNAWGEGGEVFTPCPPLVAFAADHGYAARFPEGPPADFGIDTKYGPYRGWTAAQHPRGRYALPVGPSETVLYPRPTGDAAEGDGASEAEAAAIAEAMAAHLTKKPDRPVESGDSLSAWWMYASASLAAPLFSPEQQDAVARSWRRGVEFALGPRPWFARVEPHSGARYPISFAWEDRALEILGDPNSGIGGALSGIENYARFSGDWRLVEENWQAVRRMPLYFHLAHDWTMMQSGCREHTAASAIDMDVITYEGAAALKRMARRLGHDDDRAGADMLLSRYALSSAMKWLAPAWKDPDAPRTEWRRIGIGFNEHFGFETMAARGKNPNYINSEIALSLAWIGDYPCFFSMLRAGLDDDFWRFFEFDYVENRLEDWRARHPGHRNWHDANIAPHLYLRLLLGSGADEIARELDAQKMRRPDPRMAAENAGFYALWLGGGAPLRLLDTGGARLRRFDWNKKDGTVEAVLEAQAPTILLYETANGTRGELPLAAGENTPRWNNEGRPL